MADKQGFEKDIKNAMVCKLHRQVQWRPGVPPSLERGPFIPLFNYIGLTLGYGVYTPRVYKGISISLLLVGSCYSDTHVLVIEELLFFSLSFKKKRIHYMVPESNTRSFQE